MLMQIKALKIKRVYFLIALMLLLLAVYKDDLLSKKELLPNVESIRTDNYMNKQLEFYYYIPPKVQKDTIREHPVLVCIPGLGGEGKYFMNSPFQKFAETEGFILICPSFKFDEKNWEQNASYQYPAVWSGAALITMVKKIEQKYGLHTGKYYLYGFSAGAQYALRFPLWKPEICAAAAGHGSGGPLESSPAIPVKYFISVGKQDTDRIQIANYNYRLLEKSGIDVKYKQYEGGHRYLNYKLKKAWSLSKVSATK
jgi:poly(3-hydroxybutyrate) depolymerase